MFDALADNISNYRFVAWDTETTGVATATDEVVEIAAVAFDEDFELRRFGTLIKPVAPIPPDATRIHGITDAMVVAAPCAREGVEQFFEFLKFTGRPRILLAHNAKFDVGMVYGECKRMKTILPELEAPEWVLDTCMLAKALLPDLPSHSLGALATHFNVTIGRHHRAMDDSLALQQIFLKLLTIAADRCVERGKGFTLEQLIDMCGGYFVLHPSDVEAKNRPFRLPPRIEALEKLCGATVKVAIIYEVEQDYRYITPLSVKARGARVYVEAFCHRDSVKKSFRADKILKIGKIEEA